MIPTIVSNDALTQVLSEQLDNLVYDIAPVPHKTAHRMYAAQLVQPEGPVPILIRFFHGFRCDEEARTEAVALRDLCRLGYPVPELYLHVENNKLAGAPFIVMQHLPGDPLTEI